MGYVHTHKEIPAIDGCDGPNRVQNVMKKSKNIIEKLRILIEL